MKQYLDALRYIYENGEDVQDRTGVGTRTVFGYQMRFDLSKGFPAVTTKKLAWKAVVGELLWFLSGSTDERRLAEITFEKSRYDLVSKRTIWTDNADNQGKQLGYLNNKLFKELGPVYGSQWTDFNGSGVNQILEIIDLIKNNPDSRRIVLSAWNPEKLSDMALPPCHVLAQFRVMNGKLNCHMYQRSADFGLGVPFNIASYSLLTFILAQICGLEVGEYVHSFGDAHIYQNHFEAVKEQLTRTPLELPELKMPKFSNLEELLETRPSQYILENYEHLPTIKMEMAI